MPHDIDVRKPKPLEACKVISCTWSFSSFLLLLLQHVAQNQLGYRVFNGALIAQFFGLGDHLVDGVDQEPDVLHNARPDAASLGFAPASLRSRYR